MYLLCRRVGNWDYCFILFSCFLDFRGSIVIPPPQSIYSDPPDRDNRKTQERPPPSKPSRHIYNPPPLHTSVHLTSYPNTILRISRSPGSSSNIGSPFCSKTHLTLIPAARTTSKNSISRKYNHGRCGVKNTSAVPPAARVPPTVAASAVCWEWLNSRSDSTRRSNFAGRRGSCCRSGDGSWPQM